VARLRQISLETVPTISSERAELLTDFWSSAPETSMPVKRALAFRHILLHKTITISDGELIVGERGPAAKAVPTYPELCCHSLEDLDILDRREKVFYRVSDRVREVYRDRIIPFWQGRAMRDIIFSHMTPEWLDAYQAGIFTEFMEQRAPGHTVLDDKIYRRGMNAFRQDIRRAMEQLDWHGDPQAFDKHEELRAMDICAEAIVLYARRHAELAQRMADEEADPARAAELRTIAEVCRRVPAEAPRTLHEALQSYWFCHLGVITELNTWDSFWRAMEQLDWHGDPQAFDKHEELRAMDICAEAIVLYARRHAELAQRMAEAETDPSRAAELRTIAEVCGRVPAEAPRTLHEALQSYWFCHLGVITELNTCTGGRAGTAAVLLGEVQQSAGAAQGGCDRGGERDIYGFLQCQPGWAAARRLRRRQRADLFVVGSD